MEECNMKKEQTEEQVQDHLQEETGCGNNYHSFEVTRSDRVITWVTVVLIVVAIGLVILCVTK